MTAYHTEEIRSRRLIGYGLHDCMQDMLDGLVFPDQVNKIITGTDISDDWWCYVIDRWAKTHWGVAADGRVDPERRARAYQLAHRFKDAGKIVQPLLEGRKAPDLSHGHWSFADQIYPRFSILQIEAVCP